MPSSGAWLPAADVRVNFMIDRLYEIAGVHASKELAAGPPADPAEYLILAAVEPTLGRPTWRGSYFDDAAPQRAANTWWSNERSLRIKNRRLQKLCTVQQVSIL